MADMPTMQEIDDAEKAANAAIRQVCHLNIAPRWYLKLCAAARRGVEADRLRAERNEHARWRSELADKLHAAEAELAALKTAQPQEYPSSADDEATRWRHGEPQETDHEGRPMTYWGGKAQPEWVSVPREQIERCEALARAVMADHMAIEPRWISVNQSMPVEEGDDLCDWLTWNEADGFLVAEWDQVRDGWFADGREVENVTHWMALPPIPKVN